MTTPQTRGPDRDEDGRVILYRGPENSPKCGSCPVAINGAPRVAVPGAGARGSLLILGDSPSTEEITQRYPFVGPAGQELNRVLRNHGIDRQIVWTTNALLCPRPRDDNAYIVALACCRPRVEQEIRMAAPTAVLALGRAAMGAMALQTTSISDARGTVQQSPAFPGLPVVTSIHPGAIIRGGAGEGTEGGGKQKMNMDAQMLFLEADIVKAFHIANGTLASEWSDDIAVFIEPGPLRPPVFALPPQSIVLAVPVAFEITATPLPVAAPPVDMPITDEAIAGLAEIVGSLAAALSPQESADVAVDVVNEAPTEAIPEANEATPEVAFSLFCDANPDILPTLRAIAIRVGNRDLFIELTATALEDLS